jgi:hypothetical protein
VESEFGDAVRLDVLVDSMDLFELPGKGLMVPGNSSHSQVLTQRL